MVRKKVTKKAVKRKTAVRRKSVPKVVSLKLKSGGSMRLDSKKLGCSLGKVTALIVFIVSVLAMWDKAGNWAVLADVMYGPFGYWPGRFLLGVVWGTVLGYIDGFIIGWLIAKFYNGSMTCCRMRR